MKTLLTKIAPIAGIPIAPVLVTAITVVSTACEIYKILNKDHPTEDWKDQLDKLNQFKIKYPLL